MTHTRRAALALLVGSAGLLAVETFGYSGADADRPVQFDVEGDTTAYLGLTEDGTDTAGSLFVDGEPRPEPATFAVVNQTPEPIVVTIESETFALDPVDDTGRLRTADGATELAVGERVDPVSIELPTAATADEPVSGTIEITARGERTLIEAGRSLTLDS